MTVGQKIKKMRLNKNMTQDELAIKINTTKQTIHKYENGIISNIPSSKISDIAKALDTTPDYLMGWSSESKSESKLNFELIELINSLTSDQAREALNYIDYLKRKDNSWVLAFEKCSNFWFEALFYIFRSYVPLISKIEHKF